MAKKPLPNRNLIRGVAISARGRFRIKKSIIEKIRDDLGDEYFEESRAEEGTHRFSFSASSFRAIDKRTAMLEKVKVSHCKRDYFHFEYSQQNGPRRDEKGKPYRFIVFDDDVTRVLNSLSALTEVPLEITYALRPGTMAPFKPLRHTIGNLTLAGIKVMLTRRGKDWCFLDWESGEHLTAILRIHRRVRITGDWPDPLLVHLTKALQTLRRSGVTHETDDAT